MRKPIILLFLGALFLSSCGLKPDVLFNGKSLDGWVCVTADPAEGETFSEPTFSVQNGALHISGKPNGYIRTEKKYADYILYLEWRWTDGRVDGGIFNRLQDGDKVWPAGVQLQLRERDFGYFFSGIPLEGFEHAPYIKASVAEQDPEKADGEWNETVIICKGNSISALVNGVLVNEAVSDATEGYIGLQSEGGAVEFRNIKLLPQ